LSLSTLLFLNSREEHKVFYQNSVSLLIYASEMPISHYSKGYKVIETHLLKVSLRRKHFSMTGDATILMKTTSHHNSNTKIKRTNKTHKYYLMGTTVYRIQLGEIVSK
jgi:hypothetical protein